MSGKQILAIVIAIVVGYDQVAVGVGACSALLSWAPCGACRWGNLPPLQVHLQQDAQQWQAADLNKKWSMDNEKRRGKFCRAVFLFRLKNPATTIAAG